MRRESKGQTSVNPPGVFRSSTFRRTLLATLTVWLLTAAAVWTARQIEPVDSMDELGPEVEVAILEALQEIVVAERELGDEHEGDSDFDEDGDLDEDNGEYDSRLMGYPEFVADDWGRERLHAFFQESEEIRAWLWEEDYCWQLLTPDDAWIDGNLGSIPEPYVPSDELLRIAGAIVTLDPFGEPEELAKERAEWPNLPNADTRHCLVRELPLGDGHRLRLGREFQPFRLQPAAIATATLLLLGLAAAWVGSYLLARRTVHFVGDLRRARAHLEGQTLPRLRRTGQDSDFSRAATEINGILDQLDGALTTLTHVTDNIAHDLRTPLTRLQGQLDILQRSDQPSDTMITAVQEEVDQLVATFNALLRIAQVESNQQRSGFRSFDLGLVVADVGELYAPAFAERNLTFEVRVPERSVASLGDPDLWMQALSNLIDNALKYNPDGGCVDFELTGGRSPMVVLRDQGPGIPKSERDRVFQRFYRSERHQAGIRGAGLGLSLVAAVCKLHGASIHLEGEGGLVVRVVWPPRTTAS